ncbi:hypothetical protein L1987_38376 [Smallanthus sonchifolius]|uniref:Uncharacterized protein n=1 Tax=Smallanthus sonchifolius TaxID=185202 RepID=A0ACB9HIT4_9ASTR|nr:hypothetical protein L1987_38376 [Smallanthus sonchifolius]
MIPFDREGGLGREIMAVQGSVSDEEDGGEWRLRCDNRGGRYSSQIRVGEGGGWPLAMMVHPLLIVIDLLLLKGR